MGWWPFGGGTPAAAPSIGAETPGFAPVNEGQGAGLEAGAASRRLSRFRPAAEHINSLIASAGGTVLQRARWLARNNAYAINAADWWANRLIGSSGISPSFTGVTPRQKRALRQVWDDWTDEADAEGLTDLYGLQRRAARELFIAGEVFFRLRYRRPEDGLIVPFQLQMLASEMLDANDNRRLASGNVVRQGIEFDAIGRRIAYHFYRQHPADSTDQGAGASQKTRVPAAEVLHLMDPAEAGQLRGLTRFANVIVKLFVLDQYDDAELERKKTAALNTGFISPGDEEEDEGGYEAPDAAAGSLATMPDDYSAEVTLEPGAMRQLRRGEKVTFNAPADVGGNYEAFQYRNLLAAAAGLGVPYFALTGDTARGNWSSQRTALVDAKARVEAYQWSVLVFGFCRPVLQAWMQQVMLSGAVKGISLTSYLADRAKFHRVRWMTPPWQWVDPLKEIQAAVLEVQNLFKSPSDVMEASGYDAEETDRRTAADQKRRRELGISPIGHNGGPPLPAEEEPEPPPDDGQKPKPNEE
jgi:lambda family phage portal protein